MEGTVSVYEWNKLKGFSWRKLCETVSILPSGENMLPTLQLFFDPFLALVMKKSWNDILQRKMVRKPGADCSGTNCGYSIRSNQYHI